MHHICTGSAERLLEYGGQRWGVLGGHIALYGVLGALYGGPGSSIWGSWELYMGVLGALYGSFGHCPEGPLDSVLGGLCPFHNEFHDLIVSQKCSVN